jgi:pimeloyl-ACP methyl ester carboxylesterase
MKLLSALACIVALVGAAASTPPPDLSSGALADREFLVQTPAGSGYARYFGTGSLEGSADATRAIIIVHGVLRNADEYFDTGKIMLEAAHANDTLLIAPQFVEQSDLSGHAVSPRTLRWDDEWPGGAYATAPAAVSTYEVFDAMLARLADRARFPQMREVVIVGHSAGGQIVQRYAVVGAGPSMVPNLHVHFIVANPSSYFYFDNWRPVREANCPRFNHWRYGPIGEPAYVRGTTAQLESRYVTRDVTYLLGTADTDAQEWDLDRTCAGEAQGPYRFARGKTYIAHTHERHPGGTNQDYAFVTGVPHDNRRMFTSPCGIAVIFDRDRSSCGSYGRV